MKIISKLSDIYHKNKHYTDKYDLGYITHYYDNLFLNFVEKPINFLEIGTYEGGFIRLMKDYLHKDSKIHGGDITFFGWNPSGLHHVTGDMYSDTEVKKFEDNYFDVIIDDGIHSYESFTIVSKKYLPKIKKGGKLIIEDITDSKFVEPLRKFVLSLGYSDAKVIDMSKKQLSQEMYNRWVSGLFILEITK